MRYVDLDRLLGDPVVQPIIDAAEAARLAILAAPNDSERVRLIAVHRREWLAFRAQFERVYGAKCWYVECTNSGTDDDIDHFRPKGRLADDPGHGGYWWEALNWRNFRLSCHRANRLRENPETGGTHGKGDHFPLLNEGDRCTGPGDDIYREHPTLLDPTAVEDPPLLTFNIDGSIAITPEYEGDEDARRRIDDSRIYLHLDWPRFKEERQALYRRIMVRVHEGDMAQSRLPKEPGARAALRAAASDLIRMTADTEPYSRAARAFIRSFRLRDWVKKIVLPHLPHEP